MTTQVRTLPTSSILLPSEQAWAAAVLRDEHLELSEARRVQQFGRARLSKTTRIVLWALRIYVVLMMLVIAVQLWLGVHQ